MSLFVGYLETFSLGYLDSKLKIWYLVFPQPDGPITAFTPTLNIALYTTDMYNSIIRDMAMIHLIFCSMILEGSRRHVRVLCPTS